MRLLKNLRGGITQIVKRHAKVDIDNKEQTTASSEGIYYLDANNLYGGAMHRMMSYELVGVPERHGNIVHKMCDMHKSFDFSELDNTSYFYGQLVKYYEHEVDKSKFHSLESFLNFNKKLPGPIFKDEHNGHRITGFVGLRPKMYCFVDEKHVMHNAA